MLRASCLKEDEIGRRKEGGRGKEEPSSSSYSILCTLTDVLVFFFNFSFLPFLHLRLLRALRGGDPTLMMMPRCGRRERGNNMRDTPLDPPPSSSQLCICTPGEKTEANLSQEAHFPLFLPPFFLFRALSTVYVVPLLRTSEFIPHSVAVDALKSPCGEIVFHPLDQKGGPFLSIAPHPTAILA